MKIWENIVATVSNAITKTVLGDGFNQPLGPLGIMKTIEETGIDTFLKQSKEETKDDTKEKNVDSEENGKIIFLDKDFEEQSPSNIDKDDWEQINVTISEKEDDDWVKIDFCEQNKTLST